jgi:hypothetical protein
MTINRSSLFSALFAFSLFGVTPNVAHAVKLDSFFEDQNDVIVVTDFTNEGRKRETPTKIKPVYCEAISFGLDFGSQVGDKIPPSKEVLDFVVKVLADQGYQGNNEKHPPSLLLTFQWGFLPRGLGNLTFLGGDKLDLSWELENHPWINSNVLLRNMRSEAAERVMETARKDLYAISISAFDYESAEKKKPILLWQTRIAYPTRGIYMAEALPQMIEIAAPRIGRETDKPILTDLDDGPGSIEYEDIEVIGVDGEPVEPKKE